MEDRIYEDDVRAIEAKIRRRVDELVKARGYGLTSASRTWIEDPVRELRAQIRGEAGGCWTPPTYETTMDPRLEERVARLEAELTTLKRRLGELARITRHAPAVPLRPNSDTRLFDAITAVHRQRGRGSMPWECDLSRGRPFAAGPSPRPGS